MPEHSSAQIKIATRIDGAGFDHYDIYRVDIAAIEIVNFAQVVWDLFATAKIAFLAVIA